MSKSIPLLIFVLVLASCSVNKKPQKRVLLSPLTISAKQKIFHEHPDKNIDILHTTLRVSFNWDKHECLGEEAIIFTPYSYPIDSFILDAKNFIFNQISLSCNHESVDLRYNYNYQQLVIYPAKRLLASDSCVLQLNYIAQPDKSAASGSAAISDAKGLYFINTDQSEPYKPIQLWTQGETEANSNWFATVDKPFEKMTFEIHITVPDTMTTLCNGLMTNTIQNNDNSRTDIWISDKPMSAYLVMMAIGNFKKTTSTWRGKEVSYYLEPAYHPYAKNIFQHTEEMLEFYSNQLGVEYPWQKYAQVVVRDYVSGAMENTSATLHGEFVQKNNRELLDKQNDGIIAHELFHQWFGDLVTCESWSHLTLNEGFATFGEQLWFGYKYGREKELSHIYNSMRSYLRYSKRYGGPLVHFYFDDKEDMFNPITYQKGARIINLLKYTLGDKAFFSGIKHYLETFAYKDAEASNLKQSLEKTSGKDLSYFFQQWFYRGGHPKITLNATVTNDSIALEINQTQEDSLFSFPFQFRYGDSLYTVHCQKQKTKYTVPNKDVRQFIYPDPNGIFIGEIENKTIQNDQLIPYFDAATNYIEKMRLLDFINEKDIKTKNETDLLLHAISDTSSYVATTAIRYANWEEVAILDKAKDELINVAKNSKNNDLRSEAINILARTSDTSLLTYYLEWTNSPSYKVAAAALNACKKITPEKSLRIAQQVAADADAELFEAIANIYGELADSTCNFFEYNLMRQVGNSRNIIISNYSNWASRMPPYQQNVFWQSITQHAKNDTQAWTRYAAILALNDFITKTKQTEKMLDLEQIMHDEKDARVRRQLINKKLLPKKITENE